MHNADRDAVIAKLMVEALRNDPETKAWVRDKGLDRNEHELKNIWAKVEREAPKAVTLDDFFAYMPTHSYIYAPTREMWPASSVNARGRRRRASRRTYGSISTARSSR